jgi:glycosyltransferase involved in cell wall biosynthesis
VDDRVEFRGHVDQPSLFRALTSESDVFLFPSLHDDSPLAVAEAVAAGLPVVCLDVGGPQLIAGRSATVVRTDKRAAGVVADLAVALDAAYVSQPEPDAGQRSLMTSRREELRRVLNKAIPHS